MRRGRAARLTSATLSLLLELREASAEPAHCRKVAVDHSKAALNSGLSVGERYFNIVQCGNMSLLISRLQPYLREFEWLTIARSWHDHSAGTAARLLPASWHLSHNAATVCVNDLSLIHI